jgi:putative transposase
MPPAAPEFRMALLDRWVPFGLGKHQLLRQYQGDRALDVLREGVRLLAEALMELEVSEQVGAGRYERTPERKTYRNGYRERVWETRVGQIPLRIPKLRQGSYFPSLLEPRRRAERALVSVVQEAYVAGVSTRKVDDLVRALGLEGCSRSEVSRICRELDEAMERFRSRPLEGEYPYVWLDAKAVRVRYDGRVVHMAAVVAIGVRQDGSREVLGFNVGASETYEFWAEFLRQLVGRGLRGVRLVISDAHEGLRRAISEILAGASWQRSRVHFMRNVLQKLPRHAQGPIAALVRTIFAQPDRAAAGRQLDQVCATLQRRFPQVAHMLQEAAEEVLTYMHFPPEHWRQIHSTNPLERLNRELARRFDVVGIFPNPQAVLRLLGAVLEELHEDWMVSRRYFSQQSMRKLQGETEPAPIPAGSEEL